MPATWPERELRPCCEDGDLALGQSRLFLNHGKSGTLIIDLPLRRSRSGVGVDLGT